MRKIYQQLRRILPHSLQMIMFVVTFVGIVLLFPHQHRFKYVYSEGKPWAYEDLIAPFDFGVKKSTEEIAAEEKEVMNDFMPYFYVESAIKDSVLQRLSTQIGQAIEKKNLPVSEKEDVYRFAINHATNIIDSIYYKGIVLLSDFPFDMQKDKDLVQLIDNNKQLNIRSIQSFYTIEDIPHVISQQLQEYNTLLDTSAIKTVLLRVIETNIKFDKQRSMRERQAMLESISKMKGMVQKEQIIVSKGEVVDKETVQILDTLKSEYEKGNDDNLNGFGVQSGQALLLLMSLLLYMLYLMFFHKQEFSSIKANFLLLIWLFIMVGLSSVILRFGTTYIFLIPFGLLPIIFRAFYNERIAIFATLMTIIICSIPVPNHMEFVIMHLFAGIIAILSLRKMDRRSQFFISSVLIFISYAVLYLGILLFQKQDIGEQYYFALLIFGGNAVLCMLAIPFIYLFEKILGLVTDISLLELSNANNRLLKEFATKAPGTFQHSLQIANLAEEAIYRIGGNALLVRTGALYHDIGKMADPFYFTENQNFGVNPHDKLSNEESAEKIIKHVSDGVRIAKRHRLPNQLIDFIKSHHGTKKAEYFYLMELKEKAADEIDEGKFSYPGPAPSTKEMAVLMMADAVEAASRSLKDATKESISDLVDKIIDAQLTSGQFNNADITFKEIIKVKRIIKNKLLNLYHVRIEYPE